MEELSPEAIEYFKKQGAKGGEKRKQNLSPERRKEIAEKAARARHAKKKEASHA